VADVYREIGTVVIWREILVSKGILMSMAEERKLIYVADDEENICAMIKTFLESEGYEVRTFSNGKSVKQAVGEKEPDLLILDIMMPGEDGLSICGWVRNVSRIPIIIVSAKDSPLDRVTGLMMGSDDYVVKPFMPLELLARVKALFRRAELTMSANREDAETSCGNLLLRPASRVALVGGAPLSITPVEFDFLCYLCRRKEAAVGKEELLRNVWKKEAGFGEERIPDDFIKRLRKKLRDKGSTARIETVWGYGCRITERSL